MAHRQKIVVVAAVTALLSCSEPTSERVPTRLAIVTVPTSVVVNRVVLPTEPSVRLEDDAGNDVARAGVAVVVSVSPDPVGTGSGPVTTLGGTTTTTTDANGVATFSGLSIRGPVGAKKLTFSATGLTSATATVSTTGGPPATIAIHAGDNQAEAEGIAVPVRPAVRLTDADDNPSPGALVAFVLTSGGGAITGSASSTAANGVAEVGSWTLGTAGTNSLEAATPILATKVTFTATALHLPVATVNATAAAGTALLPGATRQYAATTLDSVGRTLANRTVTWNSANTATATVSSAGLATAELPGTVNIIATSEGKSGSASLVVVAPTFTTQTPLTGHFGIVLNGNGPPPAGFEYGFGYYSSIHLLNPTHTLNTQLGWGSWMIPDNLTFTQPLCPVGTVARDQFTDRAATYYRDVYQTIEGGVGEWVTSRFPTAIPKFRINAVPDCYNTQMSTSAWHFYGTLLAEDKLGLAQLSNRLIVPADGLVFTGAAGFFGHAWIALPLIPAYTAPNGLAVGDQSWTLFANAANFKGPVAFFTPEVWTRVHLTDPTGRGRSHDVRPMMAGSVAIEIGQMPYYTSQEGSGPRYRRVPRLTFPTDANGRAILAQDMRFYSKAAIWDAVQSWIDNGTVATQFNPAGAVAPTVGSSFNQLKLSGESVLFTGGFTGGATTNAAGQPAFGLEWSGTMPPGAFPEYFRDNGSSQWEPVHGVCAVCLGQLERGPVHDDAERRLTRRLRVVQVHRPARDRSARPLDHCSREAAGLRREPARKLGARRHLHSAAVGGDACDARRRVARHAPCGPGQGVCAARDSAVLAECHPERSEGSALLVL
jgi:hypothetical protein